MHLPVRLLFIESVSYTGKVIVKFFVYINRNVCLRVGVINIF